MEDKIEGKITTIRVRDSTVKLLRKFQKADRETNEQIIKRLMKLADRYREIRREQTQ